MNTVEKVKDYYTNDLNCSSDLKTNACCTIVKYPDNIKRLISNINENVQNTYYGCGLVIPDCLENCNVLDLGCGTGFDVYIVSQLVGEKGSVIGVDMTKTIKNSESKFISRGDDSGTHQLELSLWLNSGLAPKEFSVNWYWEVGAGMGAALNIASELSAYVISDRASWLNFGRKGDLMILFEGDPQLFNQYSYLPVSVTK